MRKPEMLPVRLRGIDPAHSQAARIASSLVEGKLSDLTPGSDRVIVGRTIAQMLGLGVGDAITVLVPTTDSNGAPVPRLREFQVVGHLRRRPAGLRQRPAHRRARRRA